jgi:beta-lactam-binding protein with PASTA domain
MRGFFRFVLVVLLLVVVGMAAAVLTMHFAIHGAEVSVPDFHGMTTAAAGQRAASLGLRLNVENRLYSAEVPAGRVSHQSPAPGVIVRRGWRVWLTESLGARKLAIPNTLGEDQRMASIAIHKAGLQTGIVAVMPWPNAQPGKILAQSPQPNAPGADRPVVNLLVAAPEPSSVPPNSFVMPDLQGQVFTAAALSLTRMGLHLAPVQEQDVHIEAPAAPGSPQSPPPALAPPGTVIAQSPQAGFRVDPSIPVQLTVAK